MFFSAKRVAFYFLTALAWLPASHAQDPAPFKKEEIEQLVAPIALYPDPLVAQILMASTYPLEVVAAALAHLAFVERHTQQTPAALIAIASLQPAQIGAHQLIEQVAGQLLETTVGIDQWLFQTTRLADDDAFGRIVDYAAHEFR